MEFPPDSKVWIYVSSRELTDVESADINLALAHFTKEWVAHGSDLRGAGAVRYSRFIILMVDETHAGASGCSIDKSVHFLKELEQEYGITLFNRLLFSWLDNNNKVNVAPLSEIRKLYEEGKIMDSTLVFNNAITNRKDLDEKWLAPLSQSWAKTKLPEQRLLKS
jgi:hypothetical protein